MAERRGRVARREAVVTERRRRGDNDRTQVLSLSVDPDMLDTDQFDYRWINAEDGDKRLHQLTKRDDWDLVSASDDQEITTDAGTAVRRPVGSLKDGSTHYAYLARKPKVFAEEDRRRKDDRISETVAAIKRGQSVSPSGDTLQAGQADVHIPDEGISLSD